MLVSRRPLAALACALLLAIASATRAAAPPDTPIDRAIAQAAAGPVRAWDIERWRASLLAMYDRRGDVPLWLQGRSLTPAARALLAELREAASRGLKPDDYQADRLAALADSLENGPPPAADDIARVDAALSIAAARFVADVHYGRVDPRAVGYDLDVPHSNLDVGAAVAGIAAAASPRAALASFEPRFVHYSLLRQSLQKYRILAAEPGLTTLPPLPARSVKPGETYAGAEALRRLLRALGDLPADAYPASGVTPGDAARLDPALAAAVRAFQLRHGLAGDGALGRSTFAALTTPFDRRIEQIELAMERMRWLPPRIETPPIVVNIPQFRLFAFRTTEDRESAMLTMPVVVGQVFPSRNTPVFAADMRYVILRPYWDVPTSIARKEVLPDIRRKPGYLAKEGFELVRGQSDESPVVPPTPENLALAERGALRVRQRPGPKNALGDVKFMLPNRHNVYLHDTPARGLFREARRAYSHGCIRLGDPRGLLKHVLRDQPEWTDERIEAALKLDRPTRINLKQPIRVFVFYGTAIASEAGETLFFDDLYGHDARLASLLASRRPAAR
jgi:murein L,D-transpeptidase YcbB/YkuD